VQKALLFTLLAATMAIPLLAAKGGTVKAAVRRSVIATVVFCVLYWIGLVFVFPNLPSGTAAAEKKMMNGQ
jgi:hypothetical protein